MKSAILLILVAVSLIYSQDSNFIRVEGNGVVYSKPDYAIIKIGFFNTNMKLDSAQSIVSSLCQSFLSFCKELKIDSQNITTKSYRIDRKYERDDKRIEIFKGNEIVVLYNVKISNLAIVDTFLAKAVLLGSNEVQDVNFMTSKYDSLQRLALTYAMIDSRKNAEAIIKPTNRKIKSLLKTTDEWHGKYDLSSDLDVTIKVPDFIKGGSAPNSTVKKPFYIKVIPAEIKFEQKIYAVYSLE